MDPRNPTLGVVCLLIFICNVTAISVGTAPGVYDLGEVDPGRDYAFTFYLMTNSPSDILVSLAYIRVHPDIYERNHTGSYTFIPVEASQEDISSWIELPRKTFLLSPANVKTVHLPGGGTVRANEEADVIVHVPENAEPGYHAGAISLNPQFAAGGRGTGVATIGVTRFIFVFRVRGEVRRGGRIMAMVGERIKENKAKINVLFKNTGTCTVKAWVDELKIYDKFGNLTATLRSGPANVKAGEIANLQAYWVSGDIKQGEYRAEARVSYLSGHTTLTERVNIPAVIMVEKPLEMSKPIIISTTSEIMEVVWGVWGEYMIYSIKLEGDPQVAGYMKLQTEKKPDMIKLDGNSLEENKDWRWEGTILEIFYQHSNHTLEIYFIKEKERREAGFPWMNLLFIIIIIAFIIYWRFG